MARQGHGAGVLNRHGIAFEEKVGELVLALSIGVTMTVLGALTLAESATGRIVSFVAEPLVLLVVGFITAGQVFAVRYTEPAFRRSQEAAVRAIDAKAVIAAANTAFPSWLRAVVLFRFGLATLGSVLVVLLMVL